MRLGELLTRRDLVDADQLELAINRQKADGGLLGDKLVELGYIDREDLLRVLLEPPPAPKTIRETGLEAPFLSNLLLKIVATSGLETCADIAPRLHLPQSVVDALLTDLKKLSLLQVSGSTGTTVPVLRYTMTSAGKQRAMEAQEQSGYIGPAPISLAEYDHQIDKQSIMHERVSAESLAQSFSDLTLPREIFRRLGPAVNSGRSILIYGPPGNGKSSISSAIGRTFAQPVYIPHCIVVDGQIIKVFDPTVHVQMPVDVSAGDEPVRGSIVDTRWVRCRRPVIITGGELTLEMLDLHFDEISKYYEAPPQMKALGGVFIIDDFGRQRVQPRELLNRWIIPLEKRIDYLTIHTGKKFEIPFDELIIFSTNIPPADLMDAAILRRVPYKIRMDPPSIEDFKKIFLDICRKRRIELPEDLLSYLIEDFYPSRGVAPSAFHPKFIVDHAIAACQYYGVSPKLTVEVIGDALSDLIVSDSSDAEPKRPPSALPAGVGTV